MAALIVSCNFGIIVVSLKPSFLLEKHGRIAAKYL